jgi:hypothetical protein
VYVENGWLEKLPPMSELERAARGWSVHWYDRERVFRDAAAALGRADIDAFLLAMGRPEESVRRWRWPPKV